MASRRPTPLSYLFRRPTPRHRLSLHLRPSPPKTTPSQPLVAAPRPGSGPLSERRPDRALPEIPKPWKIWARTLPIFIAILTASALVLFNYQKQSSSVVASTLYALRTSEASREVLGDEIYFRDRFPWIWGEMNQLHGRIDIQFAVKGSRGSGMVRFRSVRKQRMGLFDTKEWSLTTQDGKVIKLLDDGRVDPFKGSALQAAAST